MKRRRGRNSIRHNLTPYKNNTLKKFKKQVKTIEVIQKSFWDKFYRTVRTPVQVLSV